MQFKYTACTKYKYIFLKGVFCMYTDLVQDIERKVRLVVRVPDADRVSSEVTLPELCNVKVDPSIVDYASLCMYYAGYLISHEHLAPNFFISVLSEETGERLFDYTTPHYKHDKHRDHYVRSVKNFYKIAAYNIVKRECADAFYEWTDDIKYVNSEGVCLDNDGSDDENIDYHAE